MARTFRCRVCLHEHSNDDRYWPDSAHCRFCWDPYTIDPEDQADDERIRVEEWRLSQ